MLFLGIDPGLDGAVAAINADGDLVWIRDTPTITIGKKRKTRHLLGLEMREILTNVLDGYVVIEEQQSRPGQGRVSIYKTGRGFGLWEGIVLGLMLPYDTVTPQKWTARLCRGIIGSDAKARSIIRAQRRFPTIDLNCNKERKGGRADAANLADVARMKWKG